MKKNVAWFTKKRDEQKECIVTMGIIWNRQSRQGIDDTDIFLGDTSAS